MCAGICINDIHYFLGAVMKTIGIIASGPSVTLSDCELLAEKCDEVGVVNSSWRIWPVADWLYTNDPDWLEYEMCQYGDRMWMSKYCGYWGDWDLPECVNRNFKAVKRCKPLLTQPGRLAWGGNSGYAAINLAWHFGAKRVILLGYDQKGDDFTAHHHEPHADHIKKRFNWPMWHDQFAELARVAPSHNLEIINATRDTALTCFKRVALEDL